jgi:hypothetical protein
MHHTREDVNYRRRGYIWESSVLSAQLEKKKKKKSSS